MEVRHIVLVALALADIPVYVLLFRFLFGKKGAEGSVGLGDLLDPRTCHDVGGGRKLVLLLFAAGTLVLIEYSIVLALFPGLLPRP